jgi:hypothetical protein
MSFVRLDWRAVYAQGVRMPEDILRLWLSMHARNSCMNGVKVLKNGGYVDPT